MSTELFDRAAAELASALEREIMCQIAQELIESQLPIKEPRDFWNAVVLALQNRGYQRTTGEVQYILNDSRKKGWVVPETRKYIDKAKRKAARQSEGQSKAATYLDRAPEGLQYMAQQALGLTEAQSEGNVEEDEEMEDASNDTPATISMVIR